MKSVVWGRLVVAGVGWLSASQNAMAQGAPPKTIYHQDWNERLAPGTGLQAHNKTLLGESIDLHTVASARLSPVLSTVLCA